MSKNRVRELCRLAEFEELETCLILERFCSGKTTAQCDFIPEDQQRTLLPSLNRRVRGWIQHNTGFFCLEELEGMAEYKPGKDPGGLYAKLSLHNIVAKQFKTLKLLEKNTPLKQGDAAKAQDSESSLSPEQWGKLLRLLKAL